MLGCEVGSLKTIADYRLKIQHIAHVQRYVGEIRSETSSGQDETKQREGAAIRAVTVTQQFQL